MFHHFPHGFNGHFVWDTSTIFSGETRRPLGRLSQRNQALLRVNSWRSACGIQMTAQGSTSTIPSSRTKRSNKNALLHFTEVNTCGFCDSHDHGEMLSSLYGCSGSLTSYVKVHKPDLNMLMRCYVVD